MSTTPSPTITVTTIAPVLVIILSLALLVPGITQPLMTLQANINRQALVSEGQNILQQQTSLHPAIKNMATQFLGNLRVTGESRVYDKTRSILGTASDLWRTGFRFVAALIVTFSIIVPLIKVLLMLAAAVGYHRPASLRWNNRLSKWSMADVFAIGVTIAFLAANAASSESSLIHFEADLHAGFYWFVAYSLVSGLASQLLLRCHQ